MDIHSNENEKTLFRRFLQTFQERIGGFGIEEIGRIDYEDLVSAFQRLKVKRAQELTDLRDLDLRSFFFERNGNHVGVISGVDLPASLAFIAKVDRACSLAVERFRDHKRACVLAHTIRSGKDQAVWEAPFAQFGSKPLDDSAISNESVKCHYFLDGCALSSLHSQPLIIRSQEA
jgi:hypothetical protein